MADNNERIKKIVKMEENILTCTRCQHLKACSMKPSLGKGDLAPQIVVIFPSENDFSRDRTNLALFKEKLKDKFGPATAIYYTYLVRCQPKMCRLKKECESLVGGRYLMANETCILNSSLCEGMLVEPSMEETLNCLHYLLEEIDILQPKVIVTVGEKTSSIVFKSFGIFGPLERTWDEIKDRLYEAKGFRFLPAGYKTGDDHLKMADIIAQFDLERFFETV
jgi:uracil-DNA glycosylase